MEKLTIFYDGACHLCYREVRHYFEKDRDNLLIGVDISASDFQAKDYGLVESSVNLHMHAMNEAGEVFIGVDCFAQIWKRLPLYKNLSPVLESKSLRPFLNLGYNFFAKEIRPRLPKRQCDNGSCRI